MARIRQLKPEFWTDDKIASLSRDARLLFLGLWTEADDDGRLVDSTKLLAGSLFPFDDDVTPKKLGGWLDEIIAIGLAVRYTRGAASYLYVANFKKHQKIAHPRRSSLPDPAECTPDAGATRADGPHPSDKPPTKRARDLGVKGSRGQGDEGSRGQGVVVSSSSSNHQSVEPAAADDDEDSTTTSKALALMTDRRIAAAKAAGVTIQSPARYRSAVLADVTAEFGDDAEDMAYQGRSVAAIADALCPTNSPAAQRYPDLNDHRSPLWCEDANGHAVRSA